MGSFGEISGKEEAHREKFGMWRYDGLIDGEIEEDLGETYI